MHPSIFLALAALGLANAQSSQQPAVASTCQQDLCFALHVPENTASSGSGDIYFQISAPTSYQWVALAQGTEMANANMFVMYSSANGQNVTVSPRQAPAEVMPTHDTTTQITLLEGSGIQNGKMTANVRCSNCQSWKGQSMDFRSSNTNWVYAYKTGSPLNSDSPSAIITKHDDHGDIMFDATRATSGGDTNPFVSAASGGSVSPSPSSSGNSGSSSGSSSSSGASSSDHRILITRVHGSLVAIAMVFLFPLGAILVRWGGFKNIAWIHGGVQLFAWAVFISGAGIGIYLANRYSYLNTAHAVIGLIIFSTLPFMPIVGTLHHWHFKKVGRRTLLTHGHIWTGRALILLGMINGGLGLQLVEAPNSYKIAYGVCVGVAGLVYIAAFVSGELRRAKNPPRRTEGSDGSDRDLNVDTKA